MTQAHIADRNRANAAKSTGPKTLDGKAKSAQNARRHGATRAPDPHCVASWLAVILGRPQMTHKDLMPKDEAGQLAVNLAVAEARLCAAEGALATCAGEDEEGDDFNDLFKQALDAAFDTSIHLKERRAIYSDIMQLSLMRIAKADADARRLRLLTRYAREARSARSSAIAAWSSHITASRNQNGARS